ncbi:MAG: peptide chain release factor N(5)-glutamine methyltransferase [Fimbriimonadaceae bacterium]|nr:peptide chain release factor N(5)-glutamine methyltransferase [Fimbriimonadaceae bacterium]
MTLGEWIPQAGAALRQNGVESPTLEAQVLAAHTLGRDRSWVLAHPEAELPELAANALLERRLGHEPLAYILGYREFYGRRFAVNPSVLIPRQDTETLIEAALMHPALTSDNPLRVLDIGTGSGCIAITLKLERPLWSIAATDISPKALQSAELNAESLGAVVRLLQGDLFEPVQGETFDLIVSNPPYIGIHEELAPEVREHEPASALFGGESGDEFYRRLAREVGPHLAEGGWVFVEVGYQQAEAVRGLLEAQGMRFGQAYADIQGHQRILSFSLG